MSLCWTMVEIQAPHSDTIWASMWENLSSGWMRGWWGVIEYLLFWNTIRVSNSLETGLMYRQYTSALIWVQIVCNPHPPSSFLIVILFWNHLLQLLLKWASSRQNLSSEVCKQQRRRPACASAQTDQCLCYLFLEGIISKLATSKISIF